MALWSGSIHFGMTAFVKPIAEEFGWTYLAISLAASMSSLELGLLAPVTGFLGDRFGPRKVTFLGGLVSGVGLLLLSRTNSLAMFYIAFIILSTGLSGTGQAVTTTAVANWFKKKISQTSGFVLAGYGAGGILVPVIPWLTIQYGWRVSMVVPRLGTLLFILPLSLLLRHKPEQYGYSPDGESSTISAVSPSATRTARSAEVELTAKDAIRTKAFWLLAFAFAIHFMVMQALTLHIMPYGASVHLPEATCALMAMLIPLSTVAGRLLVGWLGDIFNKIRILPLVFFLQSFGLAFLYSGHTVWHLAAFLVLFGPAFGGGVVLRAAIIREYFGRSAFGSIQGLIIGVMTIGGIIGPAFAGWIFDTKGSYQDAWLIFAIAYLSVGVILLTTRRILERPAH